MWRNHTRFYFLIICWTPKQRNSALSSLAVPVFHPHCHCLAQASVIFFLDNYNNKLLTSLLVPMAFLLSDIPDIQTTVRGDLLQQGLAGVILLFNTPSCRRHRGNFSQLLSFKMPLNTRAGIPGSPGTSHFLVKPDLVTLSLTTLFYFLRGFLLLSGTLLCICFVFTICLLPTHVLDSKAFEDRNLIFVHYWPLK